MKTMKKLLAFLTMYALALPAFAEAACDWEISGAHITATDQATVQANNKAIYALLLASKLSDSTVRMFGSNAGCLVKFIYSA